MKSRDYTLKITSNMHPVTLIDLCNVLDPITFVSKTQASKHTYTVKTKQPIPLQVFKQKTPFNYNGWRVVSA